MHGVSDSEAAVLDRSDAGMPASEIVAETGYTEDRVRGIIQRYSISDAFERHWNKRAASASEALRIAILRKHGRLPV